MLSLYYCTPPSWYQIEWYFVVYNCVFQHIKQIYAKYRLVLYTLYNNIHQSGNAYAQLFNMNGRVFHYYRYWMNLGASRKLPSTHPHVRFSFGYCVLPFLTSRHFVLVWIANVNSSPSRRQNRIISFFRFECVIKWDL